MVTQETHRKEILAGDSYSLAGAPRAEGHGLPVSQLEKALVRVGVQINPRDRKRLLRITATIPYNEKRIERFAREHSLQGGEFLDCLEISSRYNAQLSRVDELLNAGYSPEQIGDFMELREEITPTISPYSKTPLPRIRISETGETEFVPPDMSEYISYYNLMFLDSLAGWHHDMAEVKELIGEIKDRMRESQDQRGTAEVIYQMRQISETHENERIGFNELLNRTLCYIPGEFLARAGD
jgi:hypothetical protein